MSTSARCRDSYIVILSGCFPPKGDVFACMSDLCRSGASYGVVEPSFRYLDNASASLAASASRLAKKSARWLIEM